MTSQFPTPDRSPMVQVNIKRLIDDVQCYQTVRELRWPDGMTCPSCQSTQVMKHGFDDTEPARQRYECHDCETRFDDLTDTIFAGHHQPLKVWVLLSLSRLNHWLPGRETHPEVVQGTTEFHHDIADALFPQAHPIFHDATALDTAVDMLDPQPTLVKRLVGPLLFPRQLLAAGVSSSA